MAFVAQRVGMDFIGPFLFMSLRMFLGAATLSIVVLLQGFSRKKGKVKPENAVVTTESDSNCRNIFSESGVGFKALIKAGFFIGLIVFVAGSLQQVGMVYTTASKAGFLTALYIVLVPVMGITLRHKTYWNTWASVLIAVGGLYFLCITESFSIRIGDVIILIAALFWACHILATDHFVVGLSRRDVMKLCILQFLIAALLSCICSLIFDRFFEHGVFLLEDFISALPAILYVGILSTGVAFTLQAIGQQGINPSAASIIMSLEAVFSVIGGVIILNEILNGREIIGCILMFIALILSQLTAERKKRPD